MNRHADMDRTKVAIYLVTYHRHEMLKRSLASVLSQSLKNLTVYVVNDDPSDPEPENIVNSFCDLRIRIFEPSIKRGPTKNFNLVFHEKDAEYSALLEDDNWWEAQFLQEMCDLLDKKPNFYIAICNERIWRELPGNNWEDTGQNIWPVFAEQIFEYDSVQIAGNAKICNSGMLVRVDRPDILLTPDTIPVDVTEHFRERLLPKQILLYGKPLVNYAETLVTARGNDMQWGWYQSLLIASIFEALGCAEARNDFAKRLWNDCPSQFSPRAVALVGTGVMFPLARQLLFSAPFPSIVRWAASYIRHMPRRQPIDAAIPAWRNELQFLVNAPLTQRIAEELQSQCVR